ncbi:hypothetical protein O181_060559 [Austropuccinia psidii MF-1]|uniref:Integrase catalytic domain-containing protein n=1 Tax=Austropuccinia psidii MF-1 TaxID=1389203 RepID=A0A9Q3EGH2_9BASI|nr:hypothetical protein [Austropuccinia psidii MF-1]
MIKIQEPSRPWKIVHMDWVTGLPQDGDRGYNYFLVILDRFSETTIFFLCHKDYTSMNTDLLIFNRVVSWPGIFTNIISNRDPKYTAELWKTLDQICGTKVSFSTDYHTQTDDLS